MFIIYLATNKPSYFYIWFDNLMEWWDWRETHLRIEYTSKELDMFGFSSFIPPGWGDFNPMFYRGEMVTGYKITDLKRPKKTDGWKLQRIQRLSPRSQYREAYGLYRLLRNHPFEVSEYGTLEEYFLYPAPIREAIKKIL